jgi:hypothetical protein
MNTKATAEMPAIMARKRFMTESPLVDVPPGVGWLVYHFTPIRGYCQYSETMAQLLLPSLLGAVRVDVRVVPRF